MKKYGYLVLFMTLTGLALSASFLFSDALAADGGEPVIKQSGSVSESNTVADVKAETAQPVKEKVVVDAELIEKAAPSYKMRLKDIIAQAEANIKVVDKEIEQENVAARNQEREAKVKELFEKGNVLYKEGQIKEAKEQWKGALDITKDPEMRGYIEEADRKARAEDQAKRETERMAKEEQARLERETRDKARAEQERLDAERRASEKKAREEARAREMAEREATRAREAAERERARLEREAARAQEAAAAENARIAKEAQRKAESEAREAARKAEAEKTRLEREATRAKEAAERERARLERETRKQLEAAQREQAKNERLAEKESQGRSEYDHIESAKNEIDSISAKLDQAEAREKARQEEIADRESATYTK